MLRQDRIPLPLASANDGSYPRPQLVRPLWTDLSGPWAFAFDDDDRGIRVPEDVAVTGWDNIELSRVTFPSITTIAPDLDALARRAVEMLVERVGGFTGVGRHELVDFELLVRESAPAASP